jgi:hypothetical protein
MEPQQGEKVQLTARRQEPEARLQEPDGTTSGTDGTTSGTDGTTSGTDGTTSGTGGTTSGTDGTTSGTDGTTSGTGGTTSGTDGTTSGTDGTTSGTDGTTSGTDGTTSGTDGTTSGTDGTTSGTSGTTSGTGGTTSGTSDTTSGTDGTSTINESTTTSIESTTGGEGTTAPCPIGQLEGDQIALVCPTGFRRHPKYCNLFYQCTKNTDNHDFKILVLSCPEGTIYDDDKIQCLPQNETRTCNGQIAQSSFYKRLNENSLPPVSTIVKRVIPFAQPIFADTSQQSTDSLSQYGIPRD